MDELWLVRHGETEWTVSKKHTGSTDIPLTAGGERRARELEPVLAKHPFGAVFTSPLERARRTAALAGFEDAVVDDRLVELDYGEYEGRTTAEIREERPDWLLWRDGTPGGESMDEAGRRADGVIERISAVDGDVLLFGHGHFSRILGARLLGLPASEGRLLMLGPASISVIGAEHGLRAIRAWNRQAEL
ncbi:MAG TPA: histidine phosphatase family protein [Thermoleophilaceae bacterium]|nr:histidine phosphatase family protein [Thermoleophilaceae bacterium]